MLEFTLSQFKWYRKYKKGIWYRHRLTKDSEQLTFSEGTTYWARYGKINRYSEVIETKTYN